MTGAPVIVGGRFRLLDRIGSGTAGDVFRAIDRDGGAEVAVKLAGSNRPAAESRMRFEREAAALAVLVSPHVVGLIAAGATEPPDERSYLVLELLRGRTVQEELEACGAIAPGDVAAWIGQAAAALDLAHSVGIVHRDLKPSNLFLHDGGGGRVLKVLDFGLVRDLADPDGGGEGVVLVGTPLYMAPEQARRQAALLGPETDVWALGMIAVTMLTGSPYWSAGSAADVLAEITGSPMAPPSSRWPWLPAGFDRWFERSTHRVPERRYRGVVEQAEALAEALHAAAPHPVPAPAAPAAGSAGISPLAADGTLAARTPTPALIRESPAGTRPLVGRDIELALLQDRLQPGAVVTLTGPAGVGKSRLAEAVAGTLPARFPDGAWLAALTGVHDQTAAAEALARALDLPADGGRPAFETLAAALGPRRALLVLDGLEQLPSAGELVDALRRLAPEVAWLLVSRMPLGLADEQRVIVDPLELPPARVVTAEEATRYAAVQMFLQCAPLGFAISADNVDDVVDVCRIADGLPLALELAAAQVRGAEVGGVRRHLQANATVVGGARDPVRIAVDWSYGLLAEREQAILRCLAVLPAGVTFRGAQALFGGTAAGDRAALATATMRLVDSGLLRWSTAEPPRLLMLDSVRDACLAASAALAEDSQVWGLAIAHLDRIVERADEGMRGAKQDEWLALVDAEHDNLLAALARTVERDPQTALRMAARLAWYWYLRGHYQEGARWLDAALQRVSGGPDRLRALHGAGRLALLQCRYDRAAALLDECRELARRLGHVREQAEAEQLMGSLARERGDHAAARRRHWRSLTLWQKLGDRREIARTRNYLAFLAWLADPHGHPGDEDAPWRLGEAEADLAALGDREGMVWSLLNRGAIAHYRGDAEGARAALGRAFAEAAGARFQEGIAWSLNLIGLGSLARGEALQARAQLHASLRVHRRLGDLWRCASVLEALAALTVAAGRPARGAIYLGAADALRERLGTPVPPCERPLHDDCVRRGQEALGEAFAAGRERGRRTSLDAVLVMAGESQ